MSKIRLIPTNWKSPKFVIALSLIVALFLIKSAIRWIDLNYYNENIYDTWGAITTNEDWSKAQPLPKNLDKSWLASGKKGNIYYIAHALGGSGTLTANTYTAFEVSKDRGFKLYEVEFPLMRLAFYDVTMDRIPPQFTILKNLALSIRYCQ